MDISVAEAKNRLTELIRAVESGDQIVITRHGKPVAELVPAPPPRQHVQWGALRGRVKLYPGWDDPIDLDRFLAGEV